MIATLREMRQSPPLRDASGTPEGRAQPADWQILDAEKVLGIEGEPEVPRLEKTFQEKERGRPVSSRTLTAIAGTAASAFVGTPDALPPRHDSLRVPSGTDDTWLRIVPRCARASGRPWFRQ